MATAQKKRSPSVFSIPQALKKTIKTKKNKDENEVPVQDGKRESAQIKYFGLVPGNEGRAGVDAKDAYGNHFELKTSTKSNCSTARDFGPAHILKYCNRYWLLTQGKNLVDGFTFVKHYFFAPEHLEPWYAPIRARFAKGDRMMADLLDIMREKGYSDEDQTFFETTFKHGMTINNPPISKKYIDKYGIEVRDAEHLEQLVAQYPMPK